MVFPGPSNTICRGLSNDVLSWIRIGYVLHLSKTTSTTVLSQRVNQNEEAELQNLRKSCA